MAISPPGLPRSVEGLTASWLNDAIRQRFPTVTVTKATVDTVIWGTATKVLMDLQYGGDNEALRLPNKLCVKGEFDERVRSTLAAMTMTSTQIEALFYNDLAPRLNLPVARHWFAASEPGMGILILDNLTALKATFGSPAKPWSADRVEKALSVLAILHGSTWGADFSDISWLGVGPAAVRQANEFLMSESHWSTTFAKSDSFQLPAELSDRERILKGLHNMWVYDDANAHSIIHGDAHVGNTCIDEAGQPFFIDWSGPCRSCWAFDVSTFLVGALTIADRRHLEQDLLHHYLKELSLRGGPNLEWPGAWDDYRRHILNGIIWTTLPSVMQPSDNVQAMGQRYTTALLDHNTLRLLNA